MTWIYVSTDEAQHIMGKYNPFAPGPFIGSEPWQDIQRLANNAIMCDVYHKGYEQLVERRVEQLLTGQEA